MYINYIIIYRYIIGIYIYLHFLLLMIYMANMYVNTYAESSISFYLPWTSEALTGMLIYARLKNKSLAVDSLALVRYEALPQVRGFFCFQKDPKGKQMAFLHGMMR